MRKYGFNFDIGVQGYSLGGGKSKTKIACDTPEGAIEAMKACGLTALEAWTPQLNALEWQDLNGETAKYRDAGITLTAAGSWGLGSDEAQDRKYFACAKAAGLQAITCNVQWDGTKESLAGVERLAEEYDVRLALHNHGRKHKQGSKWVRDEILAAASDRIGLCLDVGWLLDSGENPEEALATYYDRIFGIHMRDCAFDRAGKFIDVVPGTGNLDMPKLLGILKERGFSGYFSIEYAGPEQDRVKVVRERAEAIRSFGQATA
ncbi:MAG: sugar phosphate isomerase/epimerase [Kiritimatiellae bacterium]|nr:sugar phosphate isomerase/epimerase [Kiritimatiellia bacterium]